MAKRLFVGNISSTVTENDLRELFSKYGNVEDILLKQKKNELEKLKKRFAFVSIHLDQDTLPRCIKDLTNRNWKGSEINVQLAKENFLYKLKNERALLKSQASSSFKESSNQKRLSSLSDSIKKQKHQAILIKMALADNGKKNSKIVFNYDNKESSTNQNYSCLAKKLPLFDNNDDHDDLKSNDQDFNIKPTHKNEKYIELQSRFAHDPRFKIDSRFVEENSEDDNIQNLKTLKQIEETIGRPVKKTFEIKKPILIPRYDPSKPETYKYLIKKIESKEVASSPTLPLLLSSSLKTKSVSRKSSETKFKKRFYEVDKSLKNIFQQNESKEEFSLLKLFGQNSLDDQQNQNKEKSISKIANVKSDNQRKTKDLKALEGKIQKNKFAKLKYEKFFFSSHDSRLKEDSFFKCDLIQTHFASWKKRRIQMSSALNKLKKRKKHVRSALAELKAGQRDKKRLWAIRKTLKRSEKQ